MGPTKFVQADVELNCFAAEPGGGGVRHYSTKFLHGEAVPVAPSLYSFVYHF